MRPLNNIKLSKSQFKHPIDALLLMNMGECCAMCERPLLADSLVWDRNKQKLVSGKIEFASWDNMLLLCHNCGQDIEKNSKQHSDLDMLIYPDRHVTFSIKNNSLFQYSLEEVNSILINEKKQAIGDSVVKKIVLIKGNTDEANLTIDMFQLNSHYYNSNRKILIVPEMEDSHLVDRRLELRTQAWSRAEAFIELFEKSENKDIRAALTTNLRNSISNGGFWSIWVTLFWQKFQDKQMMRELFAQNIDKPVNRLSGLQTEAIQPIGQGSHNHFQGLSDAWLD